MSADPCADHREVAEAGSLLAVYEAKLDEAGLDATTRVKLSEQTGRLRRLLEVAEAADRTPEWASRRAAA